MGVEVSSEELPGLGSYFLQQSEPQQQQQQQSQQSHVDSLLIVYLLFGLIARHPCAAVAFAHREARL